MNGLKVIRRVVLLAGVGAAAAVGAQDETCPVNPNVRGHENIEWSIGYAFHLTDANKDLPRVLLVGDSICNGYQGEVQRLLNGRMNVSYWVSSYCVTSPGYLRLLAFYLDEAKYDVIHFNNGLHSLGTPTAAYAAGLEQALKLMREKQPQAMLILATSTPLKDSARTEKARELNAAGRAVITRLGNIATDDLFALLDPLDRATNWSDVFHHKKNVQDLTAREFVKSVCPEAACGTAP
jgi:hypothetical protein